MFQSRCAHVPRLPIRTTIPRGNGASDDGSAKPEDARLGD